MPLLGRAESQFGGFGQLARVAFWGGVIGIAGIAMASVTLAAASTNGPDVDPVVSNAVATAAGGPFLVAAMGFAAFLMATGLLTPRTGVFARWIGVVALLGAVCFLITFLTVVDGTTDGSPFGYRVLPGHRVARRLRSGHELRQIPRCDELAAFGGRPNRHRLRMPSAAETG
jgi:hypothetical protein